MKWKRIATEFLPEKTFLIIKDDLDTLGAKETSTRRGKPKSAADTGTWPPKLKNHHHHQNRSCVVNNERPKTANLEKPSVLDPRLLKKLDMSLVSKESLCHSMTRIHLGATRGGGTTTSTTSTTKTTMGGGSSRRRQSVPVGEKSTSHASSIPRKLPPGFNDEEQEKSLLSLPPAGLASKKHSSNEHFTANDASRTEIRSELSSMKKQISRHNIRSEDENFTKKRIFDAKRLDDNNNGNNNPPSNITNNNNDNDNDNDDNNTPPKISSLSTVRKNKFSRNGVSTELQVFTGATMKNAPEPCKTCGRPDQPERFHSHPRGSTVVMKKDSGKDSLTNEKGKISVPKTIQKPVALNFRSEKNKKSKARENEVLTKGQKSNDSSPRDIEDDKSREITTSAVRRGPKTVTCYICAREFGTASFPIHEPKCMQKWERENNTLPPSQRRPRPQRPIVPVDHYEWNNAAWEQSQAQLIPCWHCGRTFLPDRVEIHQRSCKSTRKATGSSGGSPTIERPEKNDQQNRTLTGPVTVVCQYCGRNFGSRSIKIHEPQCIKKLQNEKESTSSAQRRKVISKHERSVDNVAGDLVSSSSSARLTGLQKPTTTCYICGRDFGSASIDIHEPQCLIKWQNENSKLPSHQRRKEPPKPEIIYTTDDTETHAIDWAATTEARWRSHLGQLVPCKHCKRTFNPDRVVIHERSCKGTR